jgi:LacI family transcriptional regulator
MQKARLSDLMDKRPTLRTVSDESGFAVTTVSRALAGDVKIAAATRSAIARVAARLGYEPDRAAQRLRTGKASAVAFILSPHEEILGFSGSLIAGLQMAMTGTRYLNMMAPWDGVSDPMAPVVHIVRNGLADGIVFSGTTPDDPRATYLSGIGFPFVSHGRTGMTTAHPWCDYDNASFARMAVERLAERGRRRILLIPPQPDRTYAQHMREGFLSAAAATGVTPVISETLTLSTAADQVKATTAALVEAEGIDGFICPGEVAAMAVLAGLQDGDRTVGRDVDVLAKQTSQTFDLYRPRIDTIYEDLRATGEALGQLLLRRMAGEAAETLQVLLPPKANFRLTNG